MSASPTTVPFPATGRPVLSRPPWGLLLLFVVLTVVLLGTPGPVRASAVGEPGDQHPSDWESPTPGPEVLREFAAPPAPWAAGHRGVKLALEPHGAVHAPADGVVSFSGVVVDREVLSIDHGSGYISSFEPIETDLQQGDTVTAGEVIGQLSTYDDGGYACDQPCLHWGVRHHGEYINPMLLLGPVEPSVLLPVHND
ncbi:M23 family metallopeptidase [Nesterenkonia alba]|uniref:M23 family metallopeptidase n=1 Tax=Nesterenkonia alba TaxID=515814 RepID=UPI0004054EB5|nr:M23 family metallopeptidase [Nesterenkonia alba]